MSDPSHENAAIDRDDVLDSAIWREGSYEETMLSSSESCHSPSELSVLYQDQIHSSNMDTTKSLLSTNIKISSYEKYRDLIPESRFNRSRQQSLAEKSIEAMRCTRRSSMWFRSSSEEEEEESATVKERGQHPEDDSSGEDDASGRIYKYRDTISQPIRIDYALAGNTTGLISLAAAFIVHILILFVRIEMHQGKDNRVYCNLTYPPALRLKLEGSGELVTPCESLQEIILFYEKYRQLQIEFPHVAIGRYNCPPFADLCLRTTTVFKDMEDLLFQENAGCDLGAYKIQDIGDICGMLFNKVGFIDDVDPKFVANHILAPTDTHLNDCYRTDFVTMDAESCPDLYAQNFKKTVYVFYELSPWFGFYHKYRNGFSYTQINGRPIDFTSHDISFCGSMTTSVDLKRSILSGRNPSFQVVPPAMQQDGLDQSKKYILHPCGIKPTTIFTDTFSFYQCEAHACCETTGRCCEYSTYLSYAYCPDSQDCTCPPKLHHAEPLTNVSVPLDGKIRYLDMYTHNAAIRDAAQDFLYINPASFNFESDEDMSDFYGINGTARQWLPEWLFPEKIEDPHFVNWMNAHRTSKNEIRVRWAKLPLDQLTEDIKPDKPIRIMIRNRFDTSFYSGAKSILIGDRQANLLESRKLIISLSISLVIIEGLILIGILVLICYRTQRRDGALIKTNAAFSEELSYSEEEEEEAK